MTTERSSINDTLTTVCAMGPAEIFSRLPPGRVGERDRRYLNEVLDAGFRNTEDPADIFARLESAFAERFGVRFAILHNSGTGTMQTCLLAAGVGPGDEVIVPPLTALSTAIVVVQCGAVPVFADIDPDTFNIDPVDIARQYEQVIREEHCSWLIPPVVPEDRTHTYWTYVCKLDEEKAGVDWRNFRKTFIEQGGDGLYSAWRPVHLEPVFRNLAFYARPEQSPNFDPRYQGSVKSYQVGDCPVCESLQPRLCQFKTSMQTLEKVQSQVDALRNTIRLLA